MVRCHFSHLYIPAVNITPQSRKKTLSATVSWNHKIVQLKYSYLNSFWVFLSFRWQNYWVWRGWTWICCETKVDSVNTDSVVMLHPVGTEPESCSFTVKIMRDWALQPTTRLLTRKRSERLIPFSDWFHSQRILLSKYSPDHSHNVRVCVSYNMCATSVHVRVSKYVYKCMCICPCLSKCGWEQIPQIM